MRALICAAGQVYDYGRLRQYIGDPDLVICADGGVRHALVLGFYPDLVIGDFDSADSALMGEVAARGIPVHRFPAEKDETDTHLAVNEAVRRGAAEILLVGASGDRLDHTLANILLMPGLPAAVQVTLVDDKNVVRLLRPGGRLVLPAAVGEYLSLLPLTPEARGVVAEGVKWPLNGATLRWGESLGISNEVTQSEAFVAVREGYLLVITARD